MKHLCMSGKSSTFADEIIYNDKRFENMTIENIKKLIAGDETRTLELKKTTGELKDAMHSVCAMLNSDGGESS